MVHLAKQKYKLLSEDLNISPNEAYRIVLEELLVHHPEVIPSFESFQTLSSMGHRSSVRHTPPVKKIAADLDIPEEYAKTLDGYQHLLYYGVDGQRPRIGEVDRRLVIAIFSTEESFERCVKARHVCFDGTFKVCPHPFYQLYTIHAYIGDSCLPLIYVSTPV